LVETEIQEIETRSKCDGAALSQPSRVMSNTSISCDEPFDSGSSTIVASSSTLSLKVVQ
jgi:hypothetical protein